MHEGSAEHSRFTCVDRPSRSHREQFRAQVFLRMESILLDEGVLVRALNLHRDQNSLARTGERWKIPS